MFFQHSSGGGLTILIVYVDDIIATGNDEEEIQRLKLALAREFEIKDLSPLRYFLGQRLIGLAEG